MYFALTKVLEVLHLQNGNFSRTSRRHDKKLGDKMHLTFFPPFLSSYPLNIFFSPRTSPHLSFHSLTDMKMYKTEGLYLNCSPLYVPSVLLLLLLI